MAHRRPRDVSPAPSYRTMANIETPPQPPERPGRPGHPAPPPYQNGTAERAPAPAPRFGTGIQIPQDVLDGLHPMYYRLYVGTGVIPSVRAVNPALSCLSKFFLEHVPPPFLSKDIVHHICIRENLDPHHALLYVSGGVGGGNPTTNSGQLVEIKGDERLAWGTTYRGSRDRPLQVVIARQPNAARGTQDEGGPGLPFAGLIDSAEVLQRVQTNMQHAPVTNREHIGHAIHYRLFWSQGYTAMPSANPIKTADPSLTLTYDECVSPPRTVLKYRQHIAAIEGFHPTRVKIFRRTQAIHVGIGNDIEMEPEDELVWDTTGAGSLTNPFLVVVDTPRGADGEADRQIGSTELRDVLARPKKVVRRLWGVAIVSPARIATLPKRFALACWGAIPRPPFYAIAGTTALLAIMLVGELPPALKGGSPVYILVANRLRILNSACTALVKATFSPFLHFLLPQNNLISTGHLVSR